MFVYIQSLLIMMLEILCCKIFFEAFGIKSGSITGTIIAAVVLGIINMFLQNVSNLRMIIYALALILVMLFRPGGLLGTKELYLSKFFNKSKEGK